MPLAQCLRQVLFALLRPYVHTIEFKEVEGAQSRRVVMLAIAQQVEDGEAALVHDDGLAVYDAGIDGVSSRWHPRLDGSDQGSQ